MNGLSQKQYLELPLPTEDDPRSDQQRILDSLAAAGVEERVHIPVHILRKLYPLLDNAKWKITVSLAWNGENWEMVEIEEGDTTAQHYGLAVDLGSTTVVARLLDCNSGEILKEVSCFNKQIQWGTDILSRIFYCKDNKEKLEEVLRATVESICECMDKLDASHSALSMVIAGNTTMIHFLLGMDAFCVFYTPHAVHADCPGFQLARDLDIPLKGYVYCYPAKSNYLGGDIISGMIDTELYKKNEISVFFDIGTNGEMALGNDDKIVCCATAAGPAFEGASITLGMPAMPGAISKVTLGDGEFQIETVDDAPAIGICGSGLLDAVAAVVSVGLVDETGYLCDEDEADKHWSHCIGEENGETVCYLEAAHNVYLAQSDVRKVQLAKSAIRAGIETMMAEFDATYDQIDEVALAGGFGMHLDPHSATAIGLIPPALDGKVRACGNTAGQGAVECLFEQGREATEEIAELADYLELSTDKRFNEFYIDFMGFEEE